MSNIALQIERKGTSPVTSGSNVIFDSVVYSAGNISYNAGTGVITFNEAGRYVINWWVAAQTSQSTNGTVFSISSSQGDLLESNSPLKTGEVVGIGIIEATIAPVTVSLVNTSTNTVFYSSVVPVAATLVVVRDDVPETGPKGPTGATGPTGAAGTFVFTNVAGPISIFPPLVTEVMVASVNQSVVAGQELKIDYALTIDAVVTSNWSTTFELRLYRDVTLLETRTYNTSQATSGTQSIPLSNTYVDTAPATTASTTYQLRVIATAATNVSSMSTGASIGLNIITFTP